MRTEDKLKNILRDWKEFELPEHVKREFDKIFLENDKILTIIGPRRAGKTYLCYQLIEWLKDEVPEDNILYINFEDERLHPLEGDELTKLLDIYYELFSPEEGKKYFFLDEIQEMEHWEKWCRRIDEQEKDIKLILTGSTSKLLSKELSTSLRGRTLNWKVFPFSFKEFLKTKDIDIDYEDRNIFYSTKKRSRMKALFNEYLRDGGFPEIVLEEEEMLKKKTLQEYFSTIYYKDIIERFNVGNIPALEDFLKMRLDNFTGQMTLTQSRNNLKSIGHSVGKATLKKYLNHAEEVFFLFKLEAYSTSRKKRSRNPRKIYAIDTGLVNAVRFDFSEEYGPALENIVFIELKRREKDVYYHKNEDECDFIIKEGRDIKSAIQVTKTLEGTRERELQGLEDAMEEYDLEEGLVLTENEKDDLVLDGKEIYVLPVWLWLLSHD
ncbi:MAG: ATP-binding protein [Candidatus Thermoplasmatota archaeon]|nr:ATP-binding protein [Candidatus Thermoplasmatota archaeon]MBS3789965.1 ATP-binding protein [Candidatus Thermoplasmatota archaeon]